MRYGYACINVTLAEKKIVVNRGMIKRTFLEKGIAHASQLAYQNIQDLEKIIDWNTKRDILFYRMSSDMFPWMSEYEIPDLPNFKAIRAILQRCGYKVREAGMRLTFHPGPFNVLASNNPKVIANTLKELRQHAQIMDLMTLDASPFAKINIHIGGAYGDKLSALNRFAENFASLTPGVRARLTVENDDKPNLFSVRDLLWLHEKIQIPIVFDYLHHQFCTGDLSQREALELALETWPAGITPAVHFSSAKKTYEDPLAIATAHADYIYELPDTAQRNVDIMFEAKAKELAVLKFKKEFLPHSLHP